MSMKRIAYLIYALAFICFEANAETPQEALASLPAEGQKWVNQSCSRSLGPSLWSSCVHREVAALRSDLPNISNLSAENQSWIRSSCSPSLGPSLTISCMRREKAALEAGLPNLSKLTPQQRTWLDQSCSKSLGPFLYRSCVIRESAALTGTTVPPPAQASGAAPPPRGSGAPAGRARQGYLIEVAHNDELFIINGEKYEAKTYCLGWDEGEEVMFLEGSALGVCVSAKLLNVDRKEVCEVWCE